MSGVLLLTTLAVAVMVAGAVGTLLRWGVLAVVRHRGVRGGTAWVNVPASLAAGAVAAAGWAEPATVAALALCGGVSTYSSLALEAARALQERSREGAAVVGGGMALGLLAGAAGAGAVLLLS